jgi:SynChlorMet cassette protein ScmD
VSVKTKPVANYNLVLREEFDDWAVLFDPDSGVACGLNPVGVFVWKRLDGSHTELDILRELKEDCENVPDDAAEHITEFVRDLVLRGFAGYELGELDNHEIHDHS